MASTAAYTSRAQIVPNETETPYSTPLFRPSSRHTSSFSSSPSFSSSSSSGSLSFHDPYDQSPFSPTAPLRFSSGIPFSWEQLPGIPKNGIPLKKLESSRGLLPLPPAGGSSNTFMKHNRESEISPKKLYKDPFFAALVECSKDDHEGIQSLWKSSKATKTLSDRFRFINMYTSCKRTCAVSESIVYLPRSRAYNLLNRRSS